MRVVAPQRGGRLHEHVVPLHGLVGVDDVAADARGVAVLQPGGSERRAAGEEVAVAHRLAEHVRPAVDGILEVRPGEGALDLGPHHLERRPAETGAHAVDLEELVPPVLGVGADHLPDVFKRFVVRDVEYVASGPCRHRASVRLVDEPAPVGVVERLVSRSPRHDPEPGLEAEDAYLVCNRLHPLRKLPLVAAEVEIVEMRDGQDVRVALPGLDAPIFKAEALEVLRADAGLVEVVLGGGLVEVDVPCHPARRRMRRTAAVDRAVVRHVAVAEIVPDDADGVFAVVLAREPHAEPARGKRVDPHPALGRELDERVRLAQEDRVVQQRVRPRRSHRHHAGPFRRLDATRYGVGRTFHLRIQHETPDQRRLASAATDLMHVDRTPRTVALAREVPADLAARAHQRKTVLGETLRTFHE